MIIVGQRTSDQTPRRVPAAAERPCAWCGEMVGLSPATLAMLAQTLLAQVACLDCCATGRTPPISGFATSDQQEIEAFKASGETMTEMFIKMTGEKPKKL